MNATIIRFPTPAERMMRRIFAALPKPTPRRGVCPGARLPAWRRAARDVWVRVMTMKRKRRAQADMVTIREGLISLAVEHAPASVRQVFYLAESAGLIDKTETEYKATVCRLLSDARLDGALSWHTIVDHTRAAHRAYTHTGIRGAMEDTHRLYRRAMWDHQPHRVEIWTEKETLTGVLRPTVLNWQVGLFPTRGYPSLSFLYDCAEDIEAAGRPTYIYFLGDHDPSGRDIRRNVFDRLREFAPSAEIIFETLAVTEEQIESMNLSLRPTKETDSRSADWRGGSVEVEAIPPDHLRKLVTEAIIEHVDVEEYYRIKVAEDSEADILNLISGADVDRAWEQDDGTVHIPPRPYRTGHIR